MAEAKEKRGIKHYSDYGSMEDKKFLHDEWRQAEGEKKGDKNADEKVTRAKWLQKWEDAQKY